MGYGGVLNKIVDPFGVGDTSAPNTPRPGKVGHDYLQLINAYAQGAPTVFNTEEQFKPAYADLDLSVLAKAIPQISSMLQTASPDAASIVRNINPGQTHLMDSLTKTATDQLDMGADLDPDLARLFEQSSRGADAARGLGFGPSDAFRESLGMTEFGNTLRNQRQDFATNVAGANNQYETQPALQLLSQIPSTAAAISQGSGPTIIPSGQSYDAFNTAYNARAAANIAGANNSAAAANSY